MTKDIIIGKVWTNTNNGQKLLTVPKKSGINNGDYVKLEKVEDD